MSLYKFVDGSGGTVMVVGGVEGIDNGFRIEADEAERPDQRLIPVKDLETDPLSPDAIRAAVNKDELSRHPELEARADDIRDLGDAATRGFGVTRS